METPNQLSNQSQEGNEAPRQRSRLGEFAVQVTQVVVLSLGIEAASGALSSMAHTANPISVPIAAGMSGAMVGVYHAARLR